MTRPHGLSTLSRLRAALGVRVEVRPGTHALLALLLAATLACNKDESTPTAPTRTPAEPTATKTFQGTLAPGAARFYSFTSTAYGTVRLTLTSLDGQTEPNDTTIGIGIGVPRGTDCSTSNTAIASAGSESQLNGVFEAGVLCARVYDTGSLNNPVPFVLVIAHP